MATKRKKTKNNFKAAVEATPDIKNCYQTGLAALGKYSSKIKLSGTCQGSVDIDSCVKDKYPTSNRWDYTIGYKSEAYFIEVHSANTSEVDVVLRKLAWLKQWLHHEAPELNKIKAKAPYIWLMSGGYNILKNSSQHRRIIKEGMNPKSVLSLS